ncbi:hypothetical protein [Enterococcus faecalis]
MESQQIHIALVEDENQQAIGIITMENILARCKLHCTIANRCTNF